MPCLIHIKFLKKITLTYKLLFIPFLSFYPGITEAEISCVDFSSSSGETPLNGKVSFTSNSALTCQDCDTSYQAKAYFWKFSGAEPATALGPGPHEVTYSGFGNFDVELQVTYINPQNFEQECRQQLLKKNYISVLSKENVVLKSFTAQADNKRIVFNWTTLYEKNNDLFVVEKSPDNINFTEIALVKSEGNKTTLTDYITDDKNPSKGLSYYRLKMKNMDGTFAFSGSVAVKWININELLNIAEGEKVLVVIHDKDGNELYSKVVVKGMENDVIVAIDPMQKLEPGTYLITGSSKNELFNKQMIVQQGK